MSRLDGLAALVVNFRTLEHTRALLTTLREAYPELRVLVVDNGSADASVDFLRARAEEDPRLDVVVNEHNRFHGPALDQGMRLLTTDHVLLLDSDCEIRRGGLLEPVLEAFDADPLLYAAGKQGWTNRWGYSPVDVRQSHTAYVHPFAAVFDRRKYLTLPPFVHHGAPLYRNMWAARRAGYHLLHVPVEDHVLHHGKVTASTHGYGYDRRLRAQYFFSRVEARGWRVLRQVRGDALQPPALLPGTSEG